MPMKLIAYAVSVLNCVEHKTPVGTLHAMSVQVFHVQLLCIVYRFFDIV